MQAYARLCVLGVISCLCILTWICIIISNYSPKQSRLLTWLSPLFFVPCLGHSLTFSGEVLVAWFSEHNSIWRAHEGGRIIWILFLHPTSSLFLISLLHLYSISTPPHMCGATNIHVPISVLGESFGAAPKRCCCSWVGGRHATAQYCPFLFFFACIYSCSHWREGCHHDYAFKIPPCGGNIAWAIVYIHIQVFNWTIEFHPCIYYIEIVDMHAFLCWNISSSSFLRQETGSGFVYSYLSANCPLWISDVLFNKVHYKACECAFDVHR